MAKFDVALLNLMGNSNIGVYLYATDKYVIIPEGLEEKEKEVISEILQVDIVEAQVGGSRLIGVLVAGNSNGLLLGSTVRDDEIAKLKKELDINIEVLPSKNNAVGNLVAANDKAALVYPSLEKESIRIIQDVLGVEAVARPIAGITTVGSVLVVTNKGGLVHPDATEEEVKFLEELFKVPVLTGTVNFGVSFVRTGIVANSYGALVGGETRGPEIARIQMALGGGVNE
ncbi:MAG: translation initiation factor IF-6 [Desulfurococcales archaeon]|nr:translation initiation factor IF-6 [Desulfurococcales archaeon]